MITALLILACSCIFFALGRDVANQRMARARLRLSKGPLLLNPKRSEVAPGQRSLGQPSYPVARRGVTVQVRATTPRSVRWEQEAQAALKPRSGQVSPLGLARTRRSKRREI